MARLILPYQRVEDLNGHPLPGAKMYFYESGTVNLKDTYSDEALTTENTNPVIADSQGQFGDIFLSGGYSVKLDDADDVTQPDYPAEIAALLDTSAAVLLTGAQTIAGVKTFTDRLAVKADTPTVELEENDGSANNRLWQFVAIAEQFIFRLTNDARDTFTSIFTVDRTDNTVDTVNFLSTNLQHNGNPVFSLAEWPSFSVHKNGTNQTAIVDETFTKVTWSTEEFDTNNNFASDKFTPSVAGKYQLSACCQWLNGLSGMDAIVSIYKNGVQYKQARDVLGGSSGAIAGPTISIVVDANGTTDYFEVYVFQNNEPSDLDRIVSGDSPATWFMGSRIA